MTKREQTRKELEYYCRAVDHAQLKRTLSNALELLQEDIPLRCAKCSFFNRGYCHQLDRYCSPDDYCSFGAWTPSRK